MLSKKGFLALSLLISYMHPAFSAASSIAENDPKSVFDQAVRCMADSSKHPEGIALFKQLFSNDGFGPYARCNAALLTEGASAKKDLVNPIIEGSAFGSCKPDRPLQASVCDMLMHAYEAEKNESAILVSASNRLCIDADAFSDNNNIEQTQFSRSCYHAIKSISDRALIEPNIELLYLPPSTADGQMEFLNKVLSSAEEYNIPSARIMRILSTIDNDQALDMFTELYKEQPTEAIAQLCNAAKKGHVGARDFALILITTSPCNAEENVALFTTAAGIEISLENKAQTIEQILSGIQQGDHLACGHAVSLAALPLCNEEEKMTLLTAAAEAGYALAHYALGMHYKKASKNGLARTHLTFAANAHIAQAHLELATLLSNDVITIIKSLEALAADATFPLQEKAQELLADYLCIWAKIGIEYETDGEYMHPIGALTKALKLYNAIIAFADKKLNDAIFDKYIASIDAIALHSCESEVQLYRNGLTYLTNVIETQPAAQRAYDELAKHLEAHKKFMAARKGYDLGQTSLIFRIQNQDRVINDLINRLSSEPENKVALFEEAEDHLKKQPQGAKTSSLKGIISFYKGDYKAACTHFSKAARLNPADRAFKSLAVIAKKHIKR